MVKPIELVVELGFALTIGAYNLFMKTYILDGIMDDAIKTSMQIVTSMTSIILLIYLIFRARKMYWDSQGSKYAAKKAQKEL